MNVKLKVTENSDKFRKSAIHFQKFNTYTFAPPGTSEYLKFWTAEADYCMNGYTSEDGDHIPGYFYFYLNYFPINLVKEVEVKDSKGNISKRVLKDRDFPRFYDYDRFFFEAVEEAEKQGKHLSVIKARRKGYSYKVGSMLIRNYYMYRESKGFALAAEAEFLVKDGILTKAWDGMDFIDQHTAWYKKRQRMDQKMHKRASFLMKDRSGVQLELGYKSEIMGVTLKNDPQKARGKAGKLIIFEEAGKFPNLLQAWQIARPSVEQGSFVFGTMIAFGTGGCVCAGTKVWDKHGYLYNIEDYQNEVYSDDPDLPMPDGIIGFDGEKASKENISYWQPYAEKECLRITTNTGRSLECSVDHPIYTAEQGKDRRIKKFDYVAAEDIKLRSSIGVIDEFPFESTRELEHARTIGWVIGDGTYGYDQSVRLSNCEKEINSYVEANYPHTVQLERATKNGRIYKEILIKGFTAVLRSHGIFGQTRLNKTLPEGIHGYSKESIVEFLGGLFDTDGYVNLRYNKKRGTPIAEISISQASVTILEEIRLLLQRLGIHGRIRKRMPRKSNLKDRNPWYEYTIADARSLLNFAKNIKLFPKEKQARLDRIVEEYSNIVPHIVHKGIRVERVTSIEKIGIKRIYNLTADTTHTYLANGIITHNTEGADFESLKELFERPAAYNCLEFENIWDENVTDSKCGFFIPQYANLEGHYHNPGDPDDGKPFMDEYGNTNVALAKRYILEQRQKVIENASDKRAIDRHIAEQPITPAEATLNISTNIFPKAELQRHLAYIRNNEKIRDFKHVGELYFDSNGKVKWEQTPKEKQKDIVKYKLDRHDDPTGQIVIWEHPMDDPPFGMYIAGIDPYDHDKSGTNSLGSIFIYKRFQTFEENYETIVAEYTGRPDTANDYYENIRKLLIYYNATALYENEKKGLFFYFEKNHCTYLLADQPGDLLRDIVKDTSVDRKKGIHMNTPIKDWGEGAIRDWLIEEYSPGKKNLTKIYSEALLEELISYNDTGNFDRVMSFMMVMLYRQQLHHVHVKKKKDLARKNLLFPEPIFVGEIMQKRVFN